MIPVRLIVKFVRTKIFSSRLKAAYTIALLLISLCIVLSYSIQHDITEAHRSSENLTNTSSIQRMYSQRLLLSATNLVNASDLDEYAEFRLQFQAQIADFREAHLQLIEELNDSESHQGTLIGVSTIYFGETNLANQIDAYLEAATRLSAVPFTAYSESHADFVFLASTAPSVLDGLHEVVLAFQTNSERYIEQALFYQTVILIGTLLVLAFEVVFIFRPIEHQIIHSHEVLKASEARYRMLVENMSEGFIIRDCNNKITFANEQFCNMLGRSFQEVIGTDIESFSTPESRIIIANHMDKRQKGHTSKYELTFIQPSGQQVNALVSGTPLFDEKGSFIGSFGVITDFTNYKEQEKALRESERLYLTVVTSIRKGIVLQNADGSIQTCNPSAERILGLTAEQMMGRTSVDARWRAVHEDGTLFPGETHPSMMALRTGKPVEDVIMGIYKPDNTLTWIQVNAQPLFRDGEVDPYAVVAAFNDITNLKHIETTLREREELLHMIIENIPVLIGLFDQEGQFKLVNREWERVLGWSMEAMQHVNIMEEFYPDENYRWDVLEFMVQAIPGWRDFQTRHKDGRIIDTSWANVRLSNGMSLGIGQDISERKTSERAFESARQTLELVIQASNDGFWDWDLQTNDIYFSPRWKSMLGYKDDELPNTFEIWSELIFEEDRVAALQLVEDYQLGKVDTFQATQRFYHKDGGTIHISSRAIQLKDADGNAHRMIGAHSDITELINARQVAEFANRAKSMFLANMSHELRTPLNAILGFAQLMQRDATLTSAHRHDLGIILRSGEHLLELINEVLEMSKIEAGRTLLRETTFNLYELLNDIEDMLSVRAEAKQLGLIFDRDSSIPMYVQADARKLRQILVNLIGNAIKFTDQGGVAVRVTYDDPYLYFEVEDSGRGINESDLKRIFDVFVQGSIREYDEGTGLGIPLSREFARLMGGDLGISSEVGSGSIAHFYVQVTLPEAETQSTQVVQQVKGLAPNQPTYRLLVVEDREESRLLLTSLLQALGFEVQTAMNGIEAIDRWRDWRPHLIWMDMRMPEMDGYEATRQIKAQAESNAPIIIALTASAFEHQKEAVLEAGCDDLIVKPFKLSSLIAALEKYLQVQFIYEDTIATTSPEEPSGNINLYLFEAEMLQQLRGAVVALDAELTKQIVEQMRVVDEDSAQTLFQLIDAFRFDKIRVLLEKQS